MVTPRSACPHCGDPIPLYHNLPVLSWLILRGKCRSCKQPISPRYLVIEVLTGLLFLGCYAHFGLTLATLKCVVLGYLLLGLIFTDAETKLLPDAMTLPGLALGIGFSLLVPVNDLASRIMPGLVSPVMSSEISWRIVVARRLAAGSGGRRLVPIRRGSHLPARPWGRRHGIRRRQVDGDDRRVPGNQAHGLNHFCRVAGRFAVWTEHGSRGLDEAHAPQSGARASSRASSRISSKDARRRAWQSARLALRYYEMPFGVFLGSMALLSFLFGNRLLHWYWRAL